MSGDKVAALTSLRMREERGEELSLMLAALIRNEREQRGWTQREMAELMEMRQSGISAWELGPPSLGALHLYNIMGIEDVFRMRRGTILQRLRAVEPDVEIDFESFVMSRPELTDAQKRVFCEMYRIWVVKEDNAQ